MSGDLPRLDVEVERQRTFTTVVLRRPSKTLLVLGSSQPTDILRVDVVAVRRRGGGGAVLIVPDETVWIDLWVPHSSSFHEHDVTRALERAGTFFKVALESIGARDLGMVRKPARISTAAICFDALGAGELTHHGAKLLGLAAWRCREGMLFQTALYRKDVPDLVPLLAPFDRSGVVEATTLSRAGLPAATGRAVAEAVRAAVSIEEHVELVELPVGYRAKAD